jgi:hypothetical protein
LNGGGDPTLDLAEPGGREADQRRDVRQALAGGEPRDADLATCRQHLEAGALK